MFKLFCKYFLGSKCKLFVLPLPLERVVERLQIKLIPYGELEGFICVRGNHDFALEGKVPDHLVLEIGGHRIYVCHGHMDFLSYFHYEPMAAHAKENDCDLVFFGHVHTCADVTIDNIRMLNPGSIWHNRDGSRPSYMLVHITGKDVQAVPMTYQAKNTTDGNSWLDRLLNWLSSL